jgi:hypothetical protein
VSRARRTQAHVEAVRWHAEIRWALRVLRSPKYRDVLTRARIMGIPPGLLVGVTFVDDDHGLTIGFPTEGES